MLPLRRRSGVNYARRGLRNGLTELTLLRSSVSKRSQRAFAALASGSSARLEPLEFDGLERHQSVRD